MQVVFRFKCCRLIFYLKILELRKAKATFHAILKSNVQILMFWVGPSCQPPPPSLYRMAPHVSRSRPSATRLRIWLTC
jgi:hypothetical protein